MSCEEGNKITELTIDIPESYGWSSYSQYDEDGIIRECLRRIESSTQLSKTFVEIGCGNGLENNTHQLLLDEFRGIWIDGSEENVNYIKSSLNGICFDELLVLNSIVDKKTLQVLQSYVIFI